MNQWLTLLPCFQHLTASSLEFSVISEQVNLEQDLFLNLGHVQNLSIDLSGSVSQQNTTVGQIANPSTKYRIGLPNSVFLKDLNLGDKAYPCSCFQIGWVTWCFGVFIIYKTLTLQMDWKMAPKKEGTSMFLWRIHAIWWNYSSM